MNMAELAEVHGRAWEDVDVRRAGAPLPELCESTDNDSVALNMNIVQNSRNNASHCTSSGGCADHTSWRESRLAAERWQGQKSGSAELVTKYDSLFPQVGRDGPCALVSRHMGLGAGCS